MSSGVKKTNAMRMLDSAKIPYEVRTYEFEETDSRAYTRQTPWACRMRRYSKRSLRAAIRPGLSCFASP